MEHFSKNLDAHVQRLRDIMDSVPLTGVSILTGSNGSGKSLIRNQILFSFARKLGKDVKDMKGFCGSTSMQRRTESVPDWGGLSSIMHDTAWMPTSICTLDLIRNLLPKEGKDSFKYIIIDEPEIGMGEEVVMALCEYLNENFIKYPDLGFLIITHNRYMVENLKSDYFFNCDGFKTKQEWLDRPIVKADLKVLEENALFEYIQDRNKKD